MESVCVYCSSSSHVDGRYFAAAERVGALIAQRIGTLVFGGNDVGMMKTVADATKRAGGRVVGVTPKLMDEKGISYAAADELVVTDTMRQRKQLMEDRADGFVALPGGFGTLEEFFEILTHKQLGYHHKPIVLLNTDGFYAPLIEMFERIYDQRFAKPVYRTHYHVADTPEAAVDYLLAYKPGEAVDKW